MIEGPTFTAECQTSVAASDKPNFDGETKREVKKASCVSSTETIINFASSHLLAVYATN
jgi:hypothetical protein